MTVATNQTLSEPTIVTARERVLGYDVARALAILGMLLVHFGYVMSAPGWQETNWSTVMASLDGRSAATFIMLVGVGITLRTSRAASQNGDVAVRLVRRTFIRRGIYLLVFGTLLLVIWPGEILRVYGVAMLIACCFISARSSWLWTAMAGFVLGFIGLFLTMDYGRNFDWENLTYHNLWTVGGQFWSLFFDGFRSVFPWAAFLLFGMWLGRQDLERPDTTRRWLVIALAIALSTELVSWALMRYFTARAQTYGMDEESVTALFGTGSMPPLPIFLLAAGSSAVAIICGSLLLSQRYKDHYVVRALAATGQLAFTWYIAHIVLGLGTVVLLDLETRWPLSVGLATGLGFFLLACGLSLLYKRRFKHGPLEWLMRTVAG